MDIDTKEQLDANDNFEYSQFEENIQYRTKLYSPTAFIDLINEEKELYNEEKVIMLQKQIEKFPDGTTFYAVYGLDKNNKRKIGFSISYENSEVSLRSDDGATPVVGVKCECTSNCGSYYCDPSITAGKCSCWPDCPEEGEGDCIKKATIEN